MQPQTRKSKQPQNPFSTGIGVLGLEAMPWIKQACLAKGLGESAISDVY